LVLPFFGDFGSVWPVRAPPQRWGAWQRAARPDP